MAETPAATRIILCVHGAMSLLAALVPPLGRLFELSLANHGTGYLLPLVTFWVVTPVRGAPISGILTLLLSSLAAVVYFTKLERELCTLRFAAWAVLSAVCVGIGHHVIMLLAACVVRSAWHTQCAGLWPLLIIVITRRFLTQADGATQSLWGVVQIQARWYPLALVVFFSLLSMRLQVDMLIAWFVGVAAHHFDGGRPLHPAIGAFRLPLHGILPSLPAVAHFEDTVGMGSGKVLGGGAEPLALQIKMFPAVVARAVSRACPKALIARYIGAHHPSVRVAIGGAGAGV